MTHHWFMAGPGGKTAHARPYPSPNYINARCGMSTCQTWIEAPSHVRPCLTCRRIVAQLSRLPPNPTEAIR